MTAGVGAEGAQRALDARARCIAVHVGAGLYGLPIEYVQEVSEDRPVTRVFHAPPVVAGVTSLRGEVLAVLDLALLLGVPAPESGRGGRIVVVRELGPRRRRAGLRIGALAGLRDLPEAGLAPLATTVSESLRALAAGVIPDPPPCVVLDVPRLFDAPALEAVAGATEP
ncbi:MAG: CheW domain-containing protein [Polyangiaceae bacterium]|nr:CheW domain-containing protein [Polyangiaceae bacterium]